MGIRLTKGIRYPGQGYHKVICDVCGFELRAKDCILVTDKYNYLYNMLVCKKDYEESNPQDRVRAIIERQIDNPAYIRNEGTDKFGFASEPDEIESADPSDPVGRTASAPRHLTIIGATASQIELQWLGPDDSGSSTANGYKIERESPVGGGFSTLVTTSTPSQYYKDTTVSSGTQYNYRVSVVNDAGAGDTSEEAAITTP